MAAIKGIFYDFESEAEFDALVQKVRGRCTKEEGGCEIWPGTQDRSHPGYVGKYNMRRLVFQAANPDAVLPEFPHKVLCSCGNTKCLSPAHLELRVQEEWDVDNIHRRLLAGCTRTPAEGFDVGCLLWDKCTNYGYGMINIDGSHRRVHVVALLLRDGIKTPPTGEDGKPLWVRHKCANKNCCEVTHLEWGTPKQNGEDRIRDGTSNRGDKHRGAKISSETASAIKSSWKPRGHPEYLSQAQRAEKFGVTYSLVNSIDQEDAWAHLPRPTDKPPKVKTAVEAAKPTREDFDEADMNTLVGRIAAKVKITPSISKCPTIQTPCHIFTGTSNNGYGKITYRKVQLLTHIVVCEHKMKMRTPDKLLVRHLCGNSMCCAADHLAFGTQSENRVDAILHGDSSFRFTVDDVRSIRSIPLTDTLAIQQAADHYGVRHAYIREIIKRNVWGWVE